MDNEHIPESGNSIQNIVQDTPERTDSKGSSSSDDSDSPSLLGGFGLQGFQKDLKSNDDGEDESFEEGNEGEDNNLGKQDAESSLEDEELEEYENSETETDLIETFENEDEEDEDDLESMLLKGVPTDSEIPKMRSQFVMSNQQIRDFIDPDNQKDFNEKISKINDMLQSTQKEYCLQFKPAQQEGKEFRLKKTLLEKLVYRDELDLAGNFLQLTVGRRLNDGDMPDLIEFLISDNNVIKLSLAYNDFTDDALMILAGLLLIRMDISCLNLAHNNMTPQGCQHFAQYLMQRSSLQSLKLTGMKIGEEGFNGLICLIMCGRGPYDLDVGETDMKVASFQGLCTAWQAMDRDEDFPKYLTTHPLPMSLEQLAGLKKTNNDNIRKQNSLEYRRSMVELIQEEGDGDKPDNGNLLQRSETQTIPHETKGEEEQDPVRMMEKISATILEGLFEIPEIETDNYVKTKTLIEGDEGQVEEIVDQAKGIPDTDLIIEEYHKIKKAGCVPLEPDGKPVIVCPSLYSLDVDDVLQTHGTKAKAGEKTSHFIPSTLDEIMEEAANKTATEKRSSKAPDDESANKASKKLVNRAIKEAAQFASTSDYEEKSDTAQMLLSIVLDTCQQLMGQEDSKGEFPEQELQAIWEAATEKAMKVIQTRVQQAKCSMTQNEVRGFVRKFMESTNRTFLHLLRNPFIPPLLIDVATKSCIDSVGDNNTTSKMTNNSPQSESNFDPSKVRKIVLNFLEGAISEAAHLIGTGDPYNFRKKLDSLPAVLEKSKGICDKAEGHAERVLEGFYLAGALLADDSIRTKKELEFVDENAEEPATDFLDGLFERVAELIIDTEEARKAAAAEEPPHKFPYAAMATRLVLNRPLFQDFEPTMASKFGAFIQGNSSVKCLHMRKWNLGEDGMINLMDGLVHNTNIVLLDLGSNAIGGDGSKALATFIRQNKNLKHLILNHNRLRNPGMKYITEALPESNLQFLNIAYNDISDEGLDPLMEILPSTQIKALYVVGNHFSQNTWKLLKELFDSEWLVPELCDFCLQEVDGKGMIVKNSQIRETNEWYEVSATVAKGLSRPPYFEEASHRHSIPAESN